MNHSINTDQVTNLYAEATLEELIDNNKRILETRIKKETIDDFVESLKND